MVKYPLTLLIFGFFLASACTTPGLPAAGAQTLTSMRETGPAASGIEGRVAIGPACPGPALAESPCPDRPYQATILVLDQNKEVVTRFQSGADGHFRIPLPPGSYFLRPASSGALSRTVEQAVTVKPGTFTEVTFTFDSGIR